MTVTREHLEAEARRLPRAERALLAEALIASLDEDAEIEAAWIEEVRRRDAQLRSGEVTAIPAEEVFAELEELLGP